MVDVFISYSKRDDEFARTVHEVFEQAGVSAFMAKISLRPGAAWSDEIRSTLRRCPFVLCLMSKAACESPYVNQEFGMANCEDKTIIPIVWEIDPSELPGWLGKYQAFDLRKLSMPQYKEKLTELASEIRSERTMKQVTAALVLTAFAFLLFRNSR